MFSSTDEKNKKWTEKNVGIVSSAKPSHLGLTFNFVSFGGFRAWISTWIFLDPPLCQTTTNQPKKGYSELLGETPSHFELVCKFGEFLCQKPWNFDRNIFESYWWETPIKWPKIEWRRFGCKTLSSCVGFQLWQVFVRKLWNFD